MVVSDGCRLFQVSELLKLGGDNYENMKQFSVTVEEKLFRMSAHRDRALTYKTEEVQLTAVDEVYVEQDKSGHVVKHVCRVRVFFLSFLSGKYIYSDVQIVSKKLRELASLRQREPGGGVHATS